MVAWTQKHSPSTYSKGHGAQEMLRPNCVLTQWGHQAIAVEMFKSHLPQIPSLHRHLSDLSHGVFHVFLPCDNKLTLK